jgi:hypothetical protein
LAPPYVAVTRQMTLPTSSAISSEFVGAERHADRAAIGHAFVQR